LFSHVLFLGVHHIPYSPFHTLGSSSSKRCVILIQKLFKLFSPYLYHWVYHTANVIRKAMSYQVLCQAPAAFSVGTYIGDEVYPLCSGQTIVEQTLWLGSKPPPRLHGHTSPNGQFTSQAPILTCIPITLPTIVLIIGLFYSRRPREHKHRRQERNKRHGSVNA
jgi:hypothetical protein